MGRAAAVLDRPRAVAFVALAAALTAYYYAVDSIPALPTWWDVTLLVLGLMPAVFLLVWLVLPLARARGLLPLALGLGVVAVLAELGDLEGARQLREARPRSRSSPSGSSTCSRSSCCS